MFKVGDKVRPLFGGTAPGWDEAYYTVARVVLNNQNKLEAIEVNGGVYFSTSFRLYSPLDLMVARLNYV